MKWSETARRIPALRGRGRNPLYAAASVFASATTTPARRRAKHPPGAARRAEGRGGGIKRGHDRLVRRREGRNSRPCDDSGSLPLEAALCNCRRTLRQASFPISAPSFSVARSRSRIVIWTELAPRAAVIRQRSLFVVVASHRGRAVLHLHRNHLKSTRALAIIGDRSLAPRRPLTKIRCKKLRIQKLCAALLAKTTICTPTNLP